VRRRLRRQRGFLPASGRRRSEVGVSGHADEPGASDRSRNRSPRRNEITHRRSDWSLRP
jgi:hypothetical protein